MNVVQLLLSGVADVLALVAFILAFAGIRSGKIIIGSTPILRASHPRRFWTMVSIYAGFGLLFVVVLTQGASQLLGMRIGSGFLDRVFWNVLLLVVPAAVSVLIYHAITTGAFPLKGREFRRATQPALFWTMTLMYGAVGLICLLLVSGLMPLLLARV